MSKSYIDSLDFTHLDEETDDSVDFDIVSESDFENPTTQPTQAIPPPPRVSRSRRNEESAPAERTSLDSEVAVLPSDSVDQSSNSNVSKSPPEGFEDSFVNGPSVSDSHVSSPNQTNGNGVDSNASQENAGNADDAAVTTAQPGSFKIHYDSSRGNVSVLNGQVTTRPDGSQYINTQGIHDQWEEQHDRPLRKKRMRLIQIFSIIACVFFFPSGIAAIYYAFRTEKEFDEGILRGNIDRAQKFAKRSERLIVLSFVLAFIVAALIVAVVERPYFEGRNQHAGTLVG